MKKRNFILSLTFTLIMASLPIMIVGMSIWSMLGHTIFPALLLGRAVRHGVSLTRSMWGSHIMAIIFTSLLASVGAYFLLREREMLIVRLREEIDERKGIEIRLRTKRKLLRELSARLREVEESERKRLAAELHDLVGQNLGALEIDLNLIREEMPADMPRLVYDSLRDAEVKLQDTFESIRNVITDLRPSTLDDFGLTETIRWYGEEFSRRTGIAVKMHFATLLPRLPAQTEYTLFRIFQEALINVQKHAQATEVTASMQEEDGEVRLLIGDNGVGFDRESTDNAPARKGWGLVIMAERAVTAGGRFSVRSRPGQGTQIAVEVKR